MPFLTMQPQKQQQPQKTLSCQCDNNGAHGSSLLSPSARHPTACSKWTYVSANSRRIIAASYQQQQQPGVLSGGDCPDARAHRASTWICLHLWRVRMELHATLFASTNVKNAGIESPLNGDDDTPQQTPDNPGVQRVWLFVCITCAPVWLRLVKKKKGSWWAPGGNETQRKLYITRQRTCFVFSCVRLRLNWA